MSLLKSNRRHPCEAHWLGEAAWGSGSDGARARMGLGLGWGSGSDGARARMGLGLELANGMSGGPAGVLVMLACKMQLLRLKKNWPVWPANFTLHPHTLLQQPRGEPSAET